MNGCRIVWVYGCMIGVHVCQNLIGGYLQLIEVREAPVSEGAHLNILSLPVFFYLIPHGTDQCIQQNIY